MKRADSMLVYSIDGEFVLKFDKANKILVDIEDNEDSEGWTCLRLRLTRKTITITRRFRT